MGGFANDDFRAISEVELDTLTGDSTVLRTDLMMVCH